MAPRDGPPFIHAPQHIDELDGLRGIAVLMVLAWHYLGATIDPTLALWAKAIARTLILGRTGVDLFFVLSGFLITGIILDRARSRRDFLLSFYARRCLRILPPYLLLVSVFWLFVSMGADNSAFNADTPLVRHLTFTQNEWMAENHRWGPDAISVTWSVAIEEWYYLCAPVLLLCVPRRWVPAVLVIVALASIGGRALVYTGPATAMRAYVSTAFRLDGLALGGLVAWAWRNESAHQWLQEKRVWLFRIAAMCLMATPLLAILIARDLSWHMFRWAHTYLAFFFTIVLVNVLLARGSRPVALLRSAALRFLGSVSYSVYLFHPFMLSSAFLIAGRSEHIRSASDALVVVAALFATLLLGLASRDWFERPLIRLGRRYAY